MRSKRVYDTHTCIICGKGCGIEYEDEYIKTKRNSILRFHTKCYVEEQRKIREQLNIEK